MTQEEKQPGGERYYSEEQVKELLKKQAQHTEDRCKSDRMYSPFDYIPELISIPEGVQAVPVDKVKEVITEIKERINKYFLHSQKELDINTWGALEAQRIEAEVILNYLKIILPNEK